MSCLTMTNSTVQGAIQFGDIAHGGIGHAARMLLALHFLMPCVKSTEIQEPTDLCIIENRPDF